MMFVTAKLAAALLALSAGAHASELDARASAYDPLKVITIQSPDHSAKASFIPFGATTTNFWVKDKFGKFRDIIIGFDNHTEYTTNRQYFGPVVGRYANRIKNGTFEVDGKTYHVPTNENGGLDTLHGGFVGYDQRNWTVAKQSGSSVTFTLVDADGTQGFPGTVTATVEYTLNNKAEWYIKMGATADKKTPLMLSGHHFWNLEAYKESQDLIGHYAQFPASRVVATDGILIPNGTLFNVSNTPLDFRKPKSLGVEIPKTKPYEYCGTDCTGFDNCWLYDNNKGTKPVFSLWSVNSGIKLDVTTNQRALQIYTCNGIFNASAPIGRKASQGGPLAHYTQHSCLVVEQESIIDSINVPGSFGINDIYGPGRDYLWEATYKFSTVKN